MYQYFRNALFKWSRKQILLQGHLTGASKEKCTEPHHRSRSYFRDFYCHVLVSFLRLFNFSGYSHFYTRMDDRVYRLAGRNQHFGGIRWHLLPWLGWCFGCEWRNITELQGYDWDFVSILRNVLPIAKKQKKILIKDAIGQPMDIIWPSHMRGQYLVNYAKSHWAE